MIRLACRAAEEIQSRRGDFDSGVRRGLRSGLFQDAPTLLVRRQIVGLRSAVLMAEWSRLRRCRKESAVFRAEFQPNAPRFPRHACDQISPLQRHDHLMNARRADLEKLHHIGLRWRASMQGSVMVDEREILALPVCVRRFHSVLGNLSRGLARAGAELAGRLFSSDKFGGLML